MEDAGFAIANKKRVISFKDSCLSTCTSDSCPMDDRSRVVLNTVQVLEKDV